MLEVEVVAEVGLEAVSAERRTVALRLLGPERREDETKAGKV